jgi:chromosome segregation ATPase
MTFRSGSVSDLGRALREMGESLEARRALTAASSTALPQLAEHAQALLDLYRSVLSGQRVVPRQGADDSNPSAFLQTLVDARDRRLEDLAGRQATLREEQRRRSQEVARLEEGNGRLQQETERLEAEIVRLEEELAKLEEGNGRLQQETGRLAADNVRLEEELANVRGSLQADRARLQEDLSQTRLRLASSEANLSEILGSRGWRLLKMLRRIKATVLGWR